MLPLQLLPLDRLAPNVLPEPAARATLFTIPKPFDDPHIRMIQTSAIRSWLQLVPWVEVVLCGNDAGVEAFAREEGLRWVPEIARNRQGTPLVSDAFRQVRETSDTPVYVYCNADVLLFRDLLVTIARLQEFAGSRGFLAFGRRQELDVTEPVDLSDRAGVQRWWMECRQRGRTGPLICKEYFVMTPQAMEEMPELAVGRGNWDNWLVASSRRRGLAVVDVSQCVTAIHQNHDYAHLGKSRLHCYVTGAEARENQRQAGGTHWVRGSGAEWTMTGERVQRAGWSWCSPQFWADLPAFLRLVARLPFQR